VFKIIELNNFN